MEDLKPDFIKNRPEVSYLDTDFIFRWSADDVPPRNPSVSGYGSRIPTRYRIKCRDGRERRVYAICYSNAASYYVTVNGERRFIRDSDFPTEV